MGGGCTVGQAFAPVGELQLAGGGIGHAIGRIGPRDVVVGAREVQPGQLVRGHRRDGRRIDQPQGHAAVQRIGRDQRGGEGVVLEAAGVGHGHALVVVQLGNLGQAQLQQHQRLGPLGRQARRHARLQQRGQRIDLPAVPGRRAHGEGLGERWQRGIAAVHLRQQRRGGKLGRRGRIGRRVAEAVGAVLAGLVGGRGLAFVAGAVAVAVHADQRPAHRAEHHHLARHRDRRWGRRRVAAARGTERRKATSAPATSSAAAGGQRQQKACAGRRNGRSGESNVHGLSSRLRRVPGLPEKRTFVLNSVGGRSARRITQMHDARRPAKR